MTDFSDMQAEDINVDLGGAADVIGEEPFVSEEQIPRDEDTINADAEFIQQEKQSRKSQEYEAKALGLLNAAMKITAGSPQTVADSAAIVMQGKPLAHAAGNLASADARFAHAMDWFYEGTSNPWLDFAASAIPLGLQVIRNHEPVLEPQSRGLRIPFLKRTIKFRFGIKLGRIRGITKDPHALESAVFDNPAVIARIKSQGISVARTSRRNR